MKKLIIAAAVSVALSGCGGSSAPDDYNNPDKPVVDPVDPVEPPTNPDDIIQVPGVGIDGYVGGAKVFLDENFDNTFTTGEPNDTTDKYGQFSLELLKTNECSTKAPIFLHVPVGALDSDAPGGVVEEAYSMASPPLDFLEDGSSLVITPITTKIWFDIKEQAILDGVDLSCQSLSDPITETWMENAVEKAEQSVLDSLVESNPNTSIEDLTTDDLYTDYIETGESDLHEAAKKEVDSLQKTEELQAGETPLDENSRVLSKSEYSRYKLMDLYDYYVLKASESISPYSGDLVRSIEVKAYSSATNQPVEGINGVFSYHFNSVETKTDVWSATSSSEVFTEGALSGYVSDYYCIESSDFKLLTGEERVLNNRFIDNIKLYSYEDKGQTITLEYYSCGENPYRVDQTEYTEKAETIQGAAGTGIALANYNYDKYDVWNAGSTNGVPGDQQDLIDDINTIFTNITPYSFNAYDIKEYENGQDGASNWNKKFVYEDGKSITLNHKSSGLWSKETITTDNVKETLCLEPATYHVAYNGGNGNNGGYTGDKTDPDTGTSYDLSTRLSGVAGTGDEVDPMNYWNTDSFGGYKVWVKKTSSNNNCEIKYSAWEHRGTQTVTGSN